MTPSTKQGKPAAITQADWQRSHACEDRKKAAKEKQDDAREWHVEMHECE